MVAGHMQTWFYSLETVLQGRDKFWATPALVLHKEMDISLNQMTLQTLFQCIVTQIMRLLACTAFLLA